MHERNKTRSETSLWTQANKLIHELDRHSKVKNEKQDGCGPKQRERVLPVGPSRNSKGSSEAGVPSNDKFRCRVARPQDRARESHAIVSSVSYQGEKKDSPRGLWERLLWRDLIQDVSKTVRFVKTYLCKWAGRGVLNIIVIIFQNDRMYLLCGSLRRLPAARGVSRPATASHRLNSLTSFTPSFLNLSRTISPTPDHTHSRARPQSRIPALWQLVLPPPSVMSPEVLQTHANRKPNGGRLRHWPNHEQCPLPSYPSLCSTYDTRLAAPRIKWTDVQRRLWNLSIPPPPHPTPDSPRVPTRVRRSSKFQSPISCSRILAQRSTPLPTSEAQHTITKRGDGRHFHLECERDKRRRPRSVKYENPKLLQPEGPEERPVRKKRANDTQPGRRTSLPPSDYRTKCARRLSSANPRATRLLITLKNDIEREKTRLGKTQSPPKLPSLAAACVPACLRRALLVLLPRQQHQHSPASHAESRRRRRRQRKPIPQRCHASRAPAQALVVDALPVSRLLLPYQPQPLPQRLYYVPSPAPAPAPKPEARLAPARPLWC